MSELPPGNGGKRGSEGGFIMGILYQAADPLYWVIWLFILFALMAFNELGRTSLWAASRCSRLFPSC